MPDGRSALRDSKIKAAVRPLLVVVADVRVEHRFEMALVHDEDPVETLGSDSTNEPFGIGIGPWRPPWSSNDLHTFGLEDLVEHGTESLVSVVNEESQRCGPRLSSFGKVSGDLGAPAKIGCLTGDATDHDSTRMEVDEEEDVKRLHSDRFNGEQIAGNDRCCLVPHELAPGVALRTRSPLWSDDPSDAGCRDLDADLEQLNLDTSVAPERVLSRYAPHEELGLQGDGPSWIHPVRSGPFPTNELTMPAAEGIRCHKRGHSL